MNSIIDAIQDAISHETIAYSLLKNNMRETSIRLGARRLFVQYEEDQENMIRYITDIEILRR